jgi:hypothetical protein
VTQPDEIVAFGLFDPANVARLLPERLRFLTVEELAQGGLSWAAKHLAGHPEHGAWGISFLEFVRAGTFAIEGRSPAWPRDGAAALWCARVAPRDPAAELGPGQPFLILGFWMPDRAYAAYMRRQGFWATYGEARLRREADGGWRGSLKAPGLAVEAACRPEGPVTGGSGSAGMQVFFPPRSSGMPGCVRLAFAGHRLQDCGREATWTFRGSHPLTGVAILPPTSFQSGYALSGAVYPWP